MTGSADRRRLGMVLATVGALAAAPSGAATPATRNGSAAGGSVLVPSGVLAPRLTPGVAVDADAADTIRSRAARALRLPDAALMASPAAGELCAEGLLAPTEGAGESGTSCGVPAGSDALLLLGGRDSGGASPRWRDLWEIARLPGRRGLPREAVGLLEIALLADGVAPGSVYRTLGTADGAARAFRKLDQLRPYIAWWTDGAEARHALRSGAVRMALLPADELAAAKEDAFTAGDRLRLPLVWVRPDARNGDAAARAAGETAADANATVTMLRALAAATPVAALATAAPATNGTSPALTVDGTFWRDHPDLRARFRDWLGS